ncbi:copper resistance protein B [Gilvimarinus sp. F26214L]|uniref:copper resistance protein B n=1 Tax=Gilvimarinus sp. DZF01 TaxID=3461371 RepID=UPI004045F31E
MIVKRITVPASCAALFFFTNVAASQQHSEPARPFPLPPPQWPATIDDTPLIAFGLIDRAEYLWDDDEELRVWDAQAWLGGDWNRLWLKSEGEDVVSGGSEGNVEALYARRISPYWHLQAGIRHDFSSEGDSLNHLALGVQGLGLYWFEVEATGYLSEDGDFTAELEAEYDISFTQRLVLQPRIETGLSASEVEDLGIGNGFNEVALGLRLRYEIRREFAPYIGFSWKRKLGDTADLAEAEGEDTEGKFVLLGLRLWF